MCNPALVVAGLQIGSAVVGYRAQREQARAMNAAIAENEAAQNAALAEQAEQSRKKSVDEMSERAREAMIARGRLRAIGAESGISGVTQDRLESEISFNEGVDIATLESNRLATERQIARQRDVVRADANRQRAGVRSPSLLGTGLQIAGAGAQYAARTPPNKAN